MSTPRGAHVGVPFGALRSAIPAAGAALRLGDFDGALEAFRRQDELGHRVHVARYNIACTYAAKGDRDKAFEWLREAVDAGFERPKFIREDPDLAPLRDDPRFDQLLRGLSDKDD